MTVEAVQAHIDSCDGTPPSKKTLASNITKPAIRPERLPHPHYSGLKDTALRKKLADQGIASSGSRQLMERRYTEWVTLWNANCDAKSPKGKSELKRELDVWERTQGGKANSAGKDQIIGAQIKDKDFDGKAWAAKNDDAFRDLIAKARKKTTNKVALSEPASTQANSAGGSIQTNQASQLDNKQTRWAETQAQSNSRQDPSDTLAMPNPSQYQSTPILDKDNAISPDIASIKRL
jgi:E3 ubiquitin-protein ligase RAD18